MSAIVFAQHALYHFCHYTPFLARMPFDLARTRLMPKDHFWALRVRHRSAVQALDDVPVKDSAYRQLLRLILKWLDKAGQARSYRDETSRLIL